MVAWHADLGAHGYGCAGGVRPRRLPPDAHPAPNLAPVAAEDIRWILEVTAPRVQKLNQTIYRRERPRFGHSGPRPCTDRRGTGGGRYRPGRAGPSVGRPGPRWSSPGWSSIVMNADQRVTGSGPMRGAQQTYALLDERAPRSADATGDAAELGADSSLVTARQASRTRPAGPSPSTSAGRRWRRLETAWTASLSRESSCGSPRCTAGRPVADARYYPCTTN